jgi:hypothetical protein
MLRNVHIKIRILADSGGLHSAFVTSALNVNTKLNSTALVCERSTPTERPPLVGEIGANFCGKRGVTS